MKKILFITIAILMSIFSAYSADFYVTYDFSYEGSTPSSMFVTGGECIDSTCSNLAGAQEIYSGNGFSCFNDLTPNTFNSCIDNFIIGNNIANNDRVIVKYNTNTVFGYNTFFHANEDSHLAKFFRITGFNCAFDICFSDPVVLNFEKKANAIAEIGQLNIINLDDSNKPIQIEVPVSIEETVCSAYRYTNPGMYVPGVIPSGYSDHSANTQVTLTITNNDDNTLYSSQVVTIPIEAGTCAGLAAFSWTPDAGLLNEDIKFRVETDVIDNQVSSSIADFAEVIETVYPTDLNGVCWTRAYDFTLSNVEDFNLNTSVAQISEGESLFALFSAGAFRDEAMTPMNFEARLFFNNTLVLQQQLNSGSDLDDYSLELTNEISGLSSGSYDVRLETSPVGNGCSISQPVIQTQNLQLLTVEKYDVTFIVRNEQNDNVVNANVSFELLSSDDFFVNTPIYNELGLTNSFGSKLFSDAFRGQYRYTVSADGYTPVTNVVTIGSNTNIFVTLNVNNSAPLIDLPQNFTAYFQDEIVFDIRNYISDYNDDFSDLTITSQLVSGNVVINYNAPFFTLSTNTPNTGVVRIFIKDSFNEIASDNVSVIFTNNQVPVINKFEAELDNGGTPFNATFNINVTDSDSNTLTCTLEFGDGNSIVDDCSDLDQTSYVYNNPATYNAKLTVTDGTHTISQTEQIFVFERQTPSPVINYFTISASNGFIVPTDVTLAWDVTGTPGLTTTCVLRVDSVDTTVPCTSSSTISITNSGSKNFNLIATDSDGTQVIRTLSRTFYNSDADLAGLEFNLIIDSTVEPGEFKFDIEVKNEIIALRNIKVEPIIICSGVEHRLKNSNGQLDNSITSKSINDINSFELTSDTADFYGVIPIDTSCTFKTILLDSLGSQIELSESVTFNYNTGIQRTQSIRGHSTDIMNYMSSVLANDLVKGFNTIEFTLDNNEFEGRDITITVLSAELGIDQRIEESLGAGQTRNVQVPIFIKDTTKKGMYTLRLGINDGEDKQVRYTYLRIN